MPKCEHMEDACPYIVACYTKRSKLKLEKYLTDYLRDEQACQMAFISLKKGIAVQLYDSRGGDCLVSDVRFKDLLFEKYKAYLVGQAVAQCEGTNQK